MVAFVQVPNGGTMLDQLEAYAERHGLGVVDIQRLRATDPWSVVLAMPDGFQRSFGEGPTIAAALGEALSARAHTVE